MGGAAQMILTVDIGNTTIQLGVIAGNQIQDRWRLQTNRLKLSDEYAVQIFVYLRVSIQNIHQALIVFQGMSLLEILYL